MRGSIAVALVWACFLARGAFYCALLPLWEGYDEYSHFAYLQHLVNTGERPSVQESRQSREIEESLRLTPLAWTLRDAVSGSITHDGWGRLTGADRAQRRERLLALPRALGREEPGDAQTQYEGQQPPLYYALCWPVYWLAEDWALPARVFAIRIFSVMLASAAVPVGYLAARRLLSSEAAAGAMAVMTLMPELMIDVARVGNESAAVAMGACLAYLGIRMIEGETGWRHALALGFTLGVACLTKAYFLAMLPPVCLGYAWLGWRGRDARVLARGAAVIAAAVVIAGWWYAENIITTGTLTGHMDQIALRAQGGPTLWQHALTMRWAHVCDIFFVSHIWFGGWSFLQLRSWMYLPFRVLFGAAAVWLGVRLIRRAEKRGPVLLLLGMMGALGAGLLQFAALSHRVHGVAAANGWYFYALGAAEAMLLCAGLGALPFPGAARWGGLTAATLFGALDLYGIHCALAPYYAGLIAHEGSGRIRFLGVDRLWSVDWGSAAARLMEVSPAMVGVGGLAMLWAAYLAGTAGAVWMGGRR